MKTVTLPRLELNAAVLLAKLMRTKKKALRAKISKIVYYSDSEVTLAWIRGTPNKWKTYVANRVHEIQRLTEKGDWRYVNTKENSADCASLGLLPETLINHSLWWDGPEFLKNISDNESEMQYTTEQELKRESKVAMAASLEQKDDIFERFSTLKRAVRVIAWCKRARKTNKTGEKSSILEPEELESATSLLIKLCQQQHFTEDISNITETGYCNKKSKIKSLNPFIDGHGILRVGGRLENSDFGFDKKHPIILPYGSRLAQWIIDDAHKNLMHGGNQLTLAQIRHRYWIPGAKRAVKMQINRCITCHRFRAKATQQLMGSLPGVRTKIVQKVFTNTGTDLAGPIRMKMSTGRGQKIQKGYIVLFIYMSTRAVHIEAVSDLTAEAFITAFNRFVARRGNVSRVYSDNGSNFVLANKILQLESEQAIKDYNIKIKTGLSQMGTKFYFNPPSARWFSGIWERHIGSIKYHLKRTVGERILTFEEITTVLLQIEACIEFMRPMTPLSESPTDLEVITPGHFLVGDALTAPLETNRMDVPVNRLNRWELCCRLKQEFWQKWTNDYLTQLQGRSKWTEKSRNLEIGDMVLLMDEVNAPLRWPLARVTKIFPARDGLVRVVEIRSNGKIYKRPIGKLALLPIEKSNAGETDETPQNAIKPKGETGGETEPTTIISACTIIDKNCDQKQIKTAGTRKVSPKFGIKSVLMCSIIFGFAIWECGYV